MPGKAPKIKTPHGQTEKPNIDHSYSQRNTRGITSVDLLTAGSESEELDSFKCNDCKKNNLTFTVINALTLALKLKIKKLCIVAKKGWDNVVLQTLQN